MRNRRSATATNQANSQPTPVQPNRRLTDKVSGAAPRCLATASRVGAKYTAAAAIRAHGKDRREDQSQLGVRVWSEEVRERESTEHRGERESAEDQLSV